MDFIKIRRELHQIPEIGFKEFKTQEYLLNIIKSFNNTNLELKTWKTGILVKVKGRNPSKIIAYRTDIDALPIIELTELEYKSNHDGYMHACGHDLHMAIALGILHRIAENPLKDDVLFIFQPAEEGPGGAKPLLESQELKEWWPDEVFALHVAPEYPVGTIATKTGVLFAHTSELFIDLLGKGGHAAFPHNTRDMVVASAQLVNLIQTIISRNINPLDAAVITFGKLHAGTANNIISETARLEGTIRTFTEESMNVIKQRVVEVVNGIEQVYNCKATINFGSAYYGVFNHDIQTNNFIKFLRDEQTNFVEANSAMTGEDFGFMLKEIPGFMFWLGVESDYGLHNARLNPNEKAIPFAINLIEKYLRSK
jgi:N-acetyldiaminopimelate deacetylase